jgi:hypothetical protein
MMGDGLVYSFVGQDSGNEGIATDLLEVDPDGDGPMPPELWIAGRFHSAGGLPASNFARWRPAVMPPAITAHPIVPTLCRSLPTAISFQWQSEHAASIRWQIEDPAADSLGWRDLFDGHITVNGVVVASVTGTATDEMVVRASRSVPLRLRGSVRTPCATAYTGPVVLNVAGSADFNGDGEFGTDADVEAFFACLAGNCCALCWSADFDGNGDVGTDADIEAFFRVLAGGAC